MKNELVSEGDLHLVGQNIEIIKGTLSCKVCLFACMCPWLANTHKISFLTKKKKGSTIPSLAARPFLHGPTTSILRRFYVFGFFAFHISFFLGLVSFNTFSLPDYFCFSSLLWWCTRHTITLECWEGVHVMSFHPQLDDIVEFMLMTSVWFYVLDIALILC